MNSATACIRCGKTRILFKTWIEENEGRGAKITATLYVCPDKECQKIVDEKFEEMKRKRLESEERKKSIVLKRK